jgi:hypothetical protein
MMIAIRNEEAVMTFICRDATYKIGPRYRNIKLVKKEPEP